MLAPVIEILICHVGTVVYIILFVNGILSINIKNKYI